MAISIKTHVAEEKTRSKLYKSLVEAAEWHDWDCHSEAAGIDPLLDECLGLEDAP